MRKRVAFACISSLVCAAAAGCSSSGGGSPGADDSGPDSSDQADGTGSSSGGSSSGGSSSSGSSSGATTDSGADSTVSTNDDAGDATLGTTEAGADAQEGATSEPEAGPDAGDGGDGGGNVDFDGSPSYCGAWTGLSSSAAQGYVGQTLTLSATAVGANPENLGYTWSQATADGGTIGVFGAASDEAAGPSDAMTFLCMSPGTATVTVNVDQGPVPDGGSCPANLTTTSISVTCTAYPADQVEAAWVELGSTGSATTDGGSSAGANTVIARAVTGAATCPTVTLDGSGATAMTQRVAAGTVPLRVTTSTSLGAQYSKPSIFPVQTCELVLPSGTTSAVVNAALPGGTQGITLPLPKANPETIVVIGDTGCRMQYSPPTTAADGGVVINAQWQACNDPTQYTFAATATAAAALHPDLVVHVGDYQYRDNECPPDIAGCAGSPWGYGWDTWQVDFFKPAAPLLAAAPWIVNRGNHESCTRAGQGWYRFLDTNGYDSVPNKDCNAQGATLAADAGGGFVGDNLGGYNTPYAVKVRPDTQVIVFDTSNIAKTAIAPTGTNGNMFSAYETEVEQVGGLTESNAFNIWTNHHAILGFANGPPVASPGVALLSVMESVYPNTLFPPGINMVLHGHTHLFEAIDYTPTSTDAGVANNYPATFVSGNAGTLLDTDLPQPLEAGTTPAPGAVVPPEVADVAHSPGFGFLVMQYQATDAAGGATWLLTEYKQDGTTARTHCTAQMSGQTSCDTWGELP